MLQQRVRQVPGMPGASSKVVLGNSSGVGVDQRRSRDVLRIWCVGHVCRLCWGGFRACLRLCWGCSQDLLILTILWGYVRDDLGLLWGCFEDSLAMFWEYFGYCRLRLGVF